VVTQAVTGATLADVRDTARRVFGEIEAGKTSGEFATNVTKLCNWCDFKQWCPAHGGDIGQALAAGTERVALRRREAGLPEKS
jgi:hypothetical protein